MKNIWKKSWVLFMAVLLAVSALSGCGEDGEDPAPQTTEAPGVPEETQKPKKVSIEKKTVPLPFEAPMEFVFSSGAGGWSTEIVLHNDGAFEGSYHDSDMGASGEGYLGTYYTCKFSGKFSDIKAVDANTYSMSLEEITTEETPGKEWIEDEVLYITGEPYGLEKGKNFLFYMPNTPVAGLSEEFLSWWPLRFSYGGEVPDTLSLYGIYNQDPEYGFFSLE